MIQIRVYWKNDAIHEDPYSSFDRQDTSGQQKFPEQ